MSNPTLVSRRRPSLEWLEDRTVPAVVSYTSATDLFQFTADAGDADSVTVTSPANNQVVIQVGGSDTITLANDALANADFVLSGDLKTLTINTESATHSPVAQFNVNLGDMADALTFGLASAGHNVTAVSVDGQTGVDTVSLKTMTLSGGVSVLADRIAVQEDVAVTGSAAIGLTASESLGMQAGSSLASIDGNITLKANQALPEGAGNFSGIGLNDADISTVNGAILLQGRGGNAAATGTHIGILVSNGSTIVASGTGSVTLEGAGGDGTGENYGVVLEGAGTKISSASGPIQITGTAGDGTGDFNIGVFLRTGAKVTATGGATVDVEGRGGAGVNFNSGVGLDDAGTTISSVDGDITITGFGGAGSGQQNVGVGLVDGSSVVSTGDGKISLDGTGGSGNFSDFGVRMDGAATLIQSKDGDIVIEGRATGVSTSEHGVAINGSKIETTAAADISLTGDASTAANASGIGVLMLDPVIVSAGAGDLSFDGTAKGDAAAGFLPVVWDDLTLSKTGGVVAFQARALGDSLTTNAGAYSVKFLDGVQIIDAVTFLNTGGVRFGDEADDVTIFNGGVTSTDSETTIRGRMLTDNAPIRLGVVTWQDIIISAGTSTIFLTRDVKVFGSKTPGEVFGKIDLGGVARTFTVLNGKPDVDLTFFDTIVNGKLVKDGAGTLRLAGISTYEGGTLIKAGTLLVRNPFDPENPGPTATGPGLVVVDGGTLGGKGSVGAVKVIKGRVAPGTTGTGFLYTDNVQFAHGHLFEVDLNAPYRHIGVHYDGVLVTGTVNLNKAKLKLLGGKGAGQVGRLIWIIVNDGTDKVVGTFLGLPERSIVRVGNLTGRISYRGGDGNDVVILITNPSGQL